MIGLFLSLFAGLFSVVNPIGAMPVYLALTAEEKPSDKNKIVLKSSLYLSGILLFSFLFGKQVLGFFNISLSAMRIAGGLIILSSGYALLKGDFAKSRAIDKKIRKEAREKEDISMTPLAIPMLAGPGSISYLIGLTEQEMTLAYGVLITGVVFLTGLATWVTLLISPRFVSFLGEAGFKSLSRIIGFIVMSIGIQYILTGFTTVYHTL